MSTDELINAKLRITLTIFDVITSTTEKFSVFFLKFKLL